MSRVPCHLHVTGQKLRVMGLARRGSGTWTLIFWIPQLMPFKAALYSLWPKRTMSPGSLPLLKSHHRHQCLLGSFDLMIQGPGESLFLFFMSSGFEWERIGLHKVQPWETEHDLLPGTMSISWMVSRKKESSGVKGWGGLGKREGDWQVDVPRVISTFREKKEG